MLEWILDVTQIIIADIVLSGDNALIIGMAAAAVPEESRKKVIFIGLMAAAVLRILFALIASYLISIPGLLLLGGLLLFWVCWKFYNDIKEFSLDIKRLEEKLKMPEEKIYENFFENEFFCYMTGFIAGMPFLGDLDENLRAKRLDTPRVKVPKGSIGLTEQFANIYTFESPGGWNIIGNTPLNIFDSTKEKEPNLINPGDLVTFKRISKENYQNYHE